MRVTHQFQENNNGLHPEAQTVLMGIIQNQCHFKMTDPLSFRNESFRLIMDKSQAKLSFWNDKALPFRNDGWCTFRNDRSHFEMIRPLSFRNDRMLFSSIWWITISSKCRWPSFWNEDKGLLALCWLSKRQSYLLSFKNDFAAKKIVISKRQQPQKSIETLSFQKDRRFL